VSGAANLDLSGRWTGIFNYPVALPPNGFQAVLRDSGGSISGTIAEPDGDPRGSGATLRSIVEGRRQGSAVTFTKMYEDVERMPDAVFYNGTIQPDGNEISGRWEIPGAWGGTFLMIRESGVAEGAEEQVTVSIEEGGNLPPHAQHGEGFPSEPLTSGQLPLHHTSCGPPPHLRWGGKSKSSALAEAAAAPRFPRAPRP
jgi:hypothetical protein